MSRIASALKLDLIQAMGRVLRKTKAEIRKEKIERILNKKKSQ